MTFVRRKNLSCTVLVIVLGSALARRNITCLFFKNCDDDLSGCYVSSLSDVVQASSLPEKNSAAEARRYLLAATHHACMHRAGRSLRGPEMKLVFRTSLDGICSLLVVLLCTCISRSSNLGSMNEAGEAPRGVSCAASGMLAPRLVISYSLSLCLDVEVCVMPVRGYYSVSS